MSKIKRVVTIGGGTGGFTLLSGLKGYNLDVTAIVNMADDGGSTGHLRDELGVLPPGDIRQCLVALSEESKVLRELFNYRFESGDVEGHALGNLFLSALEKMTGSFSSGLDLAHRILRIKGRVLPVTEMNARLFVKLKNGKVIGGENKINHSRELSLRGVDEVYLDPKVTANAEAVSAILKADIVVIGPGNHYCSVVPNLLVEGIPQAIVKSKAKVIYVGNLTNKQGHTDGFELDDYVDDINNILEKKRIDHVFFNSKSPNKEIADKYKESGSEQVGFDFSSRKNRDYKVVQADLISGKIHAYSKADKIANQRAFIRHDSAKLAKLVMYIADFADYKIKIN